MRTWDLPTGKPLTHVKGEGRYHFDHISLVFSADGSLLASAHGDGTVETLETKTGRQVNAFHVCEDSCRIGFELCFSPDGKSLLTAGPDSFIRQWDPVSGTELRRTDLKEDHCLCFSGDASLLATSDREGVVLLYRTSDGKAVARFKGHRGSVWSLAFSADGKRLASGGSDGTVLLWDISALQSTPPPSP